MSSTNSVPRAASTHQMLAAARQRITTLAHARRKTAARTHQRQDSRAGWEPLRSGLGIVGTLAPLIMLTGLGTDLHDLSWFVYYGWSGTNIPLGDAAPDAPAWLAWIVVAALALQWRRTAAVAAWLATAGMIIELARGSMLLTAQTGGWLFLAALAGLGLTFAPASLCGLRDIGRGPTVSVIVAVCLVLFGRLLGHQFTALYAVAWLALAAAVVYASRPRTMPGRWALLLLSAPAMSAILTKAAVDLFSFNIYRPTLSWPVVLLAFYGAPALIVTMLGGVLRRQQQGTVTGSPTS